MFLTLLRSVGAIVAALILAFVLVVAVEMFSELVYPAPPEAHEDYAAMCLHVARYPHGILAVAGLMWSGIALASTWVAGRLGNRACAMFIGLLLLAAVLFNTSMLPYTLWFKIAMPILIVAAVALAYYLLPHRKAATAVG
jgi:hypothetical protein